MCCCVVRRRFRLNHQCALSGLHTKLANPILATKSGFTIIITFYILFMFILFIAFSPNPGQLILPPWFIPNTPPQYEDALIPTFPETLLIAWNQHTSEVGVCLIRQAHLSLNPYCMSEVLLPLRRTLDIGNFHLVA